MTLFLGWDEIADGLGLTSGILRMQQYLSSPKAVKATIQAFKRSYEHYGQIGQPISTPIEAAETSVKSFLEALKKQGSAKEGIKNYLTRGKLVETDIETTIRYINIIVLPAAYGVEGVEKCFDFTITEDGVEFKLDRPFLNVYESVMQYHNDATKHIHYPKVKYRELSKTSIDQLTANDVIKVIRYAHDPVSIGIDFKRWRRDLRKKLIKIKRKLILPRTVFPGA